MPAKRAKAAAVVADVQKEPHLEVIRFTRFKEVVDKALTETLKTLSTEKLQTCYPSIAKTETGAKYLEASQDQIRQFWLDETRKEFELIYEERDLEQKLDALDRLIYDAEVLRYNDDRDQRLFPDELSPEQIVNGKLASVKRAKIELYRDKLEELSRGNESAQQELRAMVQESESLIADIESQTGDHFSGIEQESADFSEVNQHIKQLLRHINDL